MKKFTIKQAIEELQKGNFIILVDDENRENECDLIIAGEKVTPQKINWMIKFARGILCVPVDGARLDQLNIPLMVPNNTDKFQTPFTISIDAKKETTTGVSVFDRYITIKKLIDSGAKPRDFAMPGHVFPLRAAINGVLDRAGHTEAAVDLCGLAGLYPVAVIAEIMNNDGSMAKLPQLEEFSKIHNIGLVTIEDLIKFRRDSGC